MALQIVKADEIIEVKNVKILFYGQPGIGKTSIAFTGEKPLLLDCDTGAYRSAFRKDSVPVSCWEDIANIDDSDLAPYKTLAIDTVGRCLDFLAAHIIKTNPKMGFNGALTLQGYGQLKSQFAQWIKGILTLGIDVVMIAHDKEDKRGDEVAVRPDIQGGSYGEVFKIADAVGYMYRGDKSNIVDFNPTTVWEGKNVAQLPPLEIPDFKMHPDFLTGLIQQVKDSMNALSVEGKMIADMVASVREECEKAKSMKAMNAVLESLQTLPEVAKPSAKRVVWTRAKEMGLQYDTESHSFTKASKDAEPADAEEKEVEKTANEA